MVAMNKLDELADLQDKAVVLRLQREARRNELLAPLQAALAQIDAEFAVPLTETEADIESLIAEIKADVLAHGETIKGKASNLQAVWSKGRVSWDSKKLDGYAAAHPEIAAFKTVGEPSVSIRVLGK